LFSFISLVDSPSSLFAKVLIVSKEIKLLRGRLP
jgi:hypothetical protein